MMRLVDLDTGITVRAVTRDDLDALTTALRTEPGDLADVVVVEDGQRLVLDWDSDGLSVAELQSRRARDRQSVAWATGVIREHWGPE